MLLVGRLVYEKGFQLALEALPGLIERVVDVRFIVAGSGTAEQELREQASELGLDPHGTFLGWIGDDVLHSLYRIADLTVVPSIYEPFGLVALEAMASGCPCLVADTGGLREVVPNEDVGLRFRSRDPRSLAAMAERLLTDRGCVSGSWPRPRSTCSASTGPTWRARWGRSTRSWCRPACAAGSAGPSSTTQSATARYGLTKAAGTESRKITVKPSPTAAAERGGRHVLLLHEARANRVSVHQPVDEGGKTEDRAEHRRGERLIGVAIEQIGGERHQRDQREEDQVEGHQQCRRRRAGSRTSCGG